ncbi:MAG: helix-hairpin-helix domain-containing protein [Bryobacteraceae bacterium]
MRHRLPAAAAFFASIAFSQNSREAVDRATFKAVCGSCHSIAMVNGLRTESEWVEEVQQMVKIGARGTEKQLQGVMRVLQRTLTKVNVNTATPAEIAPVLDVSDATAEALVKLRSTTGNFKTIEDLKTVPGVDAAKIEKRKERIDF